MKIDQIIFTFCIFILLLSSYNTAAQKIFIDENVSYWYNINGDLQIDHQVFVDEDSVHLLLAVNFNNGKFYDEFDYLYELHESYHTLDIVDSDTINIQDHIIGIKSNKIFISIDLPYKDKLDIAVIRITNKKTGIDYAYDIPLIDDYNFSTDGLVFYSDENNNPFLQSFTNVGQSLKLKSVNEYSGPVFGFYYDHHFDEAVPPMIIEDRRAGRGLSIDSIFTVSLNQPITLSKQGLYFFQKDSSSADGVAMRVQDQYFPLVKTFDEILEPLIYISTRAETEKIRNAQNPQLAFEEYWIDLVKIPNLATSTVRNYYSRVEAANYFFTSFEEGWKSDMGLIYIIYGPPTDVYKSEEIIDWVYSQDLSMPNIRFSFYKVKNVFTDHHYTLLRKKTYDKNWFKSVELWREGKK